jgi:hypothetical protein
MKLKHQFLLATLLVNQIVFAQLKQRGIDNPMPSRQVHLDFHTSEFIPGIGEKFDKTEWQNTLKSGHINQINIFAKCHHSWSYYPT